MSLVCIFAPLAMMAQTDETIVESEDDSAYADTMTVDSTAYLPTTLPWPQNVQSRLEALVDAPMFKTSQLGLMIYDLTADSALYKKNERQMMRPASTMKLVTAIAAIDRLGGSYQFKTSLRYIGKIENRTLTGDIYCVGGFDPRFNSDDMGAFVESLVSMGVDTIRGRIIADKTMKEAELYGEGWCWDDDNPALSPLLISRKDRFVERFIKELREEGVVYDSPDSLTHEGSTPRNAYEICTRTHTIDQILMRMMKESDNLYAEALFYQIAAASGERPARASHARNYIKKLIGKTGYDPAMCKIADGSGLSLYNYVSAEIEVRLLRYAYHNSNIYLHLLPSLPVAGEDGTLRKRMRNSFTSANVHAKTGTVTGVSSLAGYLTAPNGHVICFAILNQGVLHTNNGRAFQDKVCKALCEP